MRTHVSMVKMMEGVQHFVSICADIVSLSEFQSKKNTSDYSGKLEQYHSIYLDVERFRTLASSNPILVVIST